MENRKRITMATVKTFTDLGQSRKLAEILPLESADGFWEYHNIWDSEEDEWEGYKDYPRATPYLEYFHKEDEWKKDKSDIPCWSLAALMKIIEIDKSEICFDCYGEKYRLNVHYQTLGSFCQDNELYESKIDALFAMIIKLHKRNLL